MPLASAATDSAHIARRPSSFRAFAVRRYPGRPLRATDVHSPGAIDQRPPDPEREPLARVAARWTGLAGAGVLFAFAGLGACARTEPMGEVVVNFGWQLGWGGALAALLLACGRRPLWAGLAALTSAWVLWPALALYLPFDSADTVNEGAPELTVAEVNLLYSNRDGALLRAWIEREDPDVLALLEISAHWRPIVDGLADRYPHRVITDAHTDPWAGSHFALGLLSKLPLEAVRVFRPLAIGQEAIEASVQVGGERVHLLTFHPIRPGLPEMTAARNETLAAIARDARWTARSIVLADFNATVFSPAYADFASATGLAEARRGFGRMPSWVSRRWIPGLWLDLDHVMVGRAVEVLEFGIGADFGSDHLPVRARVRIAPSGRALAAR